MSDLVLSNLGDDEDDQTITLEQYRRYAATWPVIPFMRKQARCLQCGERAQGKSKFCSRNCRLAWNADCAEFGCEECEA